MTDQGAPADWSRFLRMFLEEAAGYLATLETGLLRLETDRRDRAELVSSLFRAAHSLKGASAALGFGDIARLTHAMESVLDRIRTQALSPDAGLTSLLLRATDALRALVDDAGSGAAAPGQTIALMSELERVVGAAPKPAEPSPADAGWGLGGLFLPAEGGLFPAEQQHGRSDEESRPAASDSTPRPAGIEASMIRVAVEKVDRVLDLVGELVIAQTMVSQLVDQFTPDKLARVKEAVAEMERHTRDLQERVMAVRMVPLVTVFGRMSRLVRDLSASLGRKARVLLSGADTEIDKTIIEQIVDPLTHLVRNAVDHGIESPAERAAAGKSEQGCIRLAAFHQGGKVIIDVEDDGRGLDRDKIRAKAVATGRLLPDSNLAPEVLDSLVFEAGFSTASSVSSVSGRGVGMDIVRTNVHALGGAISLTSEPGRGTRVRISLPLSLAIVEGLCVGLGDEVYIIPLVSTVESIKPRPGDVRTISGRGEVVRVRDQVLPLIRLSHVLAVPSRQGAGSDGIVVIVEHQGHRVGLLVDELQGQSQVVIKSLETNYERIEGVLGATIMGDGRVALILDVQGLTRLPRAEVNVHEPRVEA